MAITRKFLKGMGLTEEQVETIIEAHTETVDGLKADIDKYREAAEKLPNVQRELNDLKAAGDGGLQQQLEELQKKYDAAETAHKGELEELKNQLTARDYADAISKAISAANDGKGLKFSSKGAHSAFVEALKKQGLELKDGTLNGFDDFVKAQKEADPEAFAPDTPPAKFSARIGAGNKPDNTPANVAQAKAMGAAKAATLKASNDVFSQYT